MSHHRGVLCLAFVIAGAGLLAGCGPERLALTPEVSLPAEDDQQGDLQSALLDAARGIEVVATGDTDACVIEMALQTTDGRRDHRFCLQRHATADTMALTTACGRLATRHVVLSRYTDGVDVDHTRMILQSTCPGQAQFGCEGLEGAGLTLFGYTQPDAELAQARAGCEQLGGSWRTTHG